MTQSRPTMCLGCRVINKFVQSKEEWHCSVCNRSYPRRYWTIKLGKKIGASIVINTKDEEVRSLQFRAMTTAVALVRDG